MDCSLPGSSVHGILQARILEWVPSPFSKGSTQPRNWTQVSHVAGRFYMVWATREAQSCNKPFLLCICWGAQRGFPMICRLPCSTTGVFLVVFAWKALSEMEAPWRLNWSPQYPGLGSLTLVIMCTSETPCVSNCLRCHPAHGWEVSSCWTELWCFVETLEFGNYFVCFPWNQILFRDFPGGPSG